MQHFHGNACAEKVSCPLMPFLNGTNGSTLVRQEKGNDQKTCGNALTQTCHMQKTNKNDSIFSTTDREPAVQPTNFKIQNIQRWNWTWRHGSHGSNPPTSTCSYRFQLATKNVTWKITIMHHHAAQQVQKHLFTQLENQPPLPPESWNLLNLQNKKRCSFEAEACKLLE